MRNRYVLAFSLGAFLYVATEAAIYVWMPTLLAGYKGPAAWVVPYSIPIFFLLRAAGRSLGAWMLSRLQWSAVAVCFKRDDPGVLRSQPGGTRVGFGLPAALWPLHVGDLSDRQL